MTTSLHTDKYELTMIDAALKSGVAHKPAVFAAYTRNLKGRSYGVVAGTLRVLDAIKNFRFTTEQANYLTQTHSLSEDMNTWLKNYRFNGKIEIYVEGETFFPHSPLIQLSGTFAECCILETVILSILNHDTSVANAATRMVQAGRGKRLFEFGSRRTHEQASVDAARSAFIAGFEGTSNLGAGYKYGIPVVGTSAHSFILAHKSETKAFTAQLDRYGTDTTLLVDTYDTLTGVERAIREAGKGLGGIRIDSGDLLNDTVQARQILDGRGAENTQITVSGDMDEYQIDRLECAGAPVDVYGVGTSVVTGSGFPTSGIVFKLVEIDGTPVAKSSEGKGDAGGARKVTRVFDPTTGLDVKEVVACGRVTPPVLGEGLAVREVTQVIDSIDSWGGEGIRDTLGARERCRDSVSRLSREALLGFSDEFLLASPTGFEGLGESAIPTVLVTRQSLRLAREQERGQ